MLPFRKRLNLRAGLVCAECCGLAITGLEVSMQNGTETGLKPPGERARCLKP